MPQRSLLPTFLSEWKTKFQLQISDSKVVIFLSYPRSRTPWYLPMNNADVRGTQVKNGCSIEGFFGFHSCEPDGKESALQNTLFR